MPNASTRPKIPLSRSPMLVLLEAAALTGLVLGLILVAANWSALPERIPHHFNFRGTPDAWGRKKILLLLPVVAFILYVGLTVAQRLPRHFNFLGPVDEGSAADQYRLARALIVCLKAEVLWFFTFLVWGTIRVGLEEASVLPMWGTLTFGGAIGMTLMVYFFAAFRTCRKKAKV